LPPWTRTHIRTAQRTGTCRTKAPDGLGTGLEGLAAALDALEAEDLDAMSDAELIESARELRRLTDLLKIQWLRELAWVDAHGAAGAEQGIRFPSTASWLQARLDMSAVEASSYVQTAREMFGGFARQRPPP
jgi:hypothetical protein